jgi:hypothetical protein
VCVGARQSGKGKRGKEGESVWRRGEVGEWGCKASFTDVGFVTQPPIVLRLSESKANAEAGRPRTERGKGVM